jgi:hypothetical protein
MHARKNLFVDDMPYKSIFNDSRSAIFLESFDEFPTNGNYLLSIMFLYLVLLASFQPNVQSYVNFHIE